jgi:hypothetical protein
VSEIGWRSNVSSLPAVPNVIKIEVSGLAAQSPWANIFHFTFSGGPAIPADMNTLAGHVVTSWGSHMGTFMNLQTIMNLVQTTDLTSSTGSIGAAIASVAGSDSTNPAPNNAAMVIKKRIARRYRGGHPKTFLLPQGDNQLFDGDSWKSTYVTNVKLGYDAFITGLLTTHGAITLIGEVIVSYYSGFTNVTMPSGRTKSKPTLRPVPLVDGVVSTSAEQKVGSQRRRTSKG